MVMALRIVGRSG